MQSTVFSGKTGSTKPIRPDSLAAEACVVSSRSARGSANQIDGEPADGLLRLLPGCSEWRYVADRTACRAGAEYRPCSKDPDTIAFGVVDPRVLLHAVLLVPSAIIVLHRLVEFTTLNGA